MAADPSSLCNPYYRTKPSKLKVKVTINTECLGFKTYGYES
jgi:hypothetical protein